MLSILEMRIGACERTKKDMNEQQQDKGSQEKIVNSESQISIEKTKRERFDDLILRYP